jgi:N,N-dimethylformamidase beta subunit-like, C-terminal
MKRVGEQSGEVSRRDFLSRSAVMGLGSMGLVGSAAESAANNPIVRENGRTGDAGWRLERPQVLRDFRSPAIEGYCSHSSVRAGETIELHVSTNPPREFTFDLYRLGFYGGTGGRKVRGFGSFTGTVQPDPEIGGKRVRDCRWKPSVSITIDHDWLSGVYLGKLSILGDGPQSYVIFIVRDDRRADLLFQCSDFTWQAYNRWPDHFALYDDGKSNWYWGGGVQVSFNRPYGQYCQGFVDSIGALGSGEFLLWEFPFAYWLEQHGYDVTYISNLDTHRDPTGLDRAAGFLSVGHDEYWTIEMFRNVEAAVKRGLNVGFFSGNAVCGRIALGADAAGRADRAFERVGVFGPPGGTIEFVEMKSLSHDRPYANELVGAHSTGPVTGGADWICRRPDHWVFAGTGMKAGDGIPGLVGWEWHGDPARIPGLEVLASGPTQSAPGKPNGGEFTATIYPGPKSNFVFNASTIWWADGLSAPPGYHRPSVYTTPQGPDPRVQQITRNIVDRMIARRRATVQ